MTTTKKPPIRYRKKVKPQVLDIQPTVTIRTFPHPELKGTFSEKSVQFLVVLKRNHDVINENLPLCIGINRHLHKLYPNVSNRIINSALHKHTNTSSYLYALIKASHRYNLQRLACNELVAADKQDAIKELTARREAKLAKLAKLKKKK